MQDFSAASPSGVRRAAAAPWWTLFALLFVIATRWPLAPAYLYYFDSANFAYSLENFNPALHQPQPPGYPLFVGLIRLIHLWVPRPETVLLVAGLLAACGALLLIRVLATEMFGRRAGIAAMMLLASNQVFWFAGITNQIRLFLALSALGVAFLGWRALTRPEAPVWLYAAFAATGLAGGFRPVDTALLVPLLIWVWIGTGHSIRRLALAWLSLTVAVLPSVAVVAFAVGGLPSMLRMMWQYSQEQFSGSSALYGAAGASAWHMFSEAFVWNILGSVVWLWAVPLVRKDLRAQLRAPRAAFLAVWFCPIFLFSAFVHIGDPDQALASIPVLSLVGGAVVSLLVARNLVNFRAACVAVVALHAALFFVPPTKLAKAASYKAVKSTDRVISTGINTVRSLRDPRGTTIVYYGSPVTSRHLSYYFPDDYVVVLPGSPAQPVPGMPAIFHHHRTLADAPGNPGRLFPGSRRILCLLPENASPGVLPGWKQKGPVYYRDLESETEVTIGPYRLIR